ncbi:MAG: hypothetical protein Q8O64_12145 [Sideroxyarcus sp.]|nr:hypothetical protein [Sideroxyarcus sp.]
MDNLRNQMASLMQGIATSAHERERVIGNIKEQTANMLRAFGRERTAMAKALEACLVGDRMSRSADVRAIRDNTSTMCEGFRQDQVRLRRSLRQSLDQSRETVVTSVASLRVDFAKERADFAKVHRHMAKAQRAGLIKDRRYRSHAVAELMSAFAKAHRHMAQVQWDGLAKCRRERSHSLAELMQGFHDSRGNRVRQVAKNLPRTTPVTKAPLPSSNWIAPPPVEPRVLVKPSVEPRVLVKPAAPIAIPHSEPVKPIARVTENLVKPASIAAPRREPVKPLPKVAQSFTKPLPSAPPRGEPVKSVAKKAKATSAKTVHAIAKSLKPKKK